jgi:hypothetical protein
MPALSYYESRFSEFIKSSAVNRAASRITVAFLRGISRLLALVTYDREAPALLSWGVVVFLVSPLRLPLDVGRVG